MDMGVAGSSSSAESTSSRVARLLRQGQIRWDPALPWPIAFGLLQWLDSEEHDIVLSMARHTVDCRTALVTSFLDFEHEDGIAGSGRLCSAVREVQSANRVLVVEDASADLRFRDDIMVRAFPHARFLAGAPIRVRDFPVGGLFVSDYAARPRPSEDVIKAFSALAHMCGQSIELAARRLEKPAERMQVGMMSERGHASVLVIDADGSIMNANNAASMLLRVEPQSLPGLAISTFLLGWEQLLRLVAEAAVTPGGAAALRTRPVLVEISTSDGAIVPARAAVSFLLDCEVGRYRLVLEEVP